MLYIIAASLVAFANSVEAKSTNTRPQSGVNTRSTNTRSTNTRSTNNRPNKSTTTKTLVWPHPTNNVSSGDCYDKYGNTTRCPASTSTSTTTWIIIGVVIGIIMTFLIVCLCFRKKIKALVLKKWDMKGEHQHGPSTLPLHHSKTTSTYDSHQKHDGFNGGEREASVNRSSVASSCDVAVTTSVPPRDSSHQKDYNKNVTTSPTPPQH